MFIFCISYPKTDPLNPRWFPHPQSADSFLMTHELWVITKKNHRGYKLTQIYISLLCGVIKWIFEISFSVIILKKNKTFHFRWLDNNLIEIGGTVLIPLIFYHLNWKASKVNKFLEIAEFLEIANFWKFLFSNF